MNQKTFDKLVKLFGRSYNFSGEEYWLPEQKEYQKLKSGVEKLFKKEVA
jgi:hypothetical protein